LPEFVLALDQGTTSSRSLLFDRRLRPTPCAQFEFAQHYPGPGHVEHDAEDLWKSQLKAARAAVRKAGGRAADIVALGIANQRETVVLWDRDTGRPVDRAIVWQSRVTAPACERLKKEGAEPLVRRKTGLVLDPYFSATKIRRLLDQHGLHARARRGEILAGTVDSFLIWRLTGGKVHATDYTNASRTLLFNIHDCRWDDELLALFGVPRAMLPEARPSAASFGVADKRWFGAEIPICGVAGDQQAAAFGQACFRPGMAKCTYGTGCFALLNVGTQPIAAEGLLSTIGWALGDRVTYCLEGAVFVGGAAIQWLRDGLGILKRAGDAERLARSVADHGGVYFVPALVGLGTPHWDPYARGLVIGLDRGSTAGHLVRAAVEAMAFQVRDVIDAMTTEAGVRLTELRADGGAAVNDGLMQFQADLLGRPVRRSRVRETTALGAASLAGLTCGWWSTPAELARLWAIDRQFDPAWTPAQRRRRCGEWRRAVERCRGWLAPPD
jgi:glycerol kinase